MFGRVSTVPISEYLRSNSIYLGKKFTNEYVKSSVDLGGSDNGIYYPKLSGWVDVDASTGERSYPDYSLPSDIPEWVIAKEVNFYSGAIENAKRFIIETDGCIGPFTLQEAVRFYSVVKKLKPDNLSGGINISVGDHSLDILWSESIESDFLVFTPDQDNPNDLFTPSLKGCSGLSIYGTNDEIEIETGTHYSSGLSFIGFAGEVFIVADIDNLSDFYIVKYPTTNLNNTSLYSGLNNFGTITDVYSSESLGFLKLESYDEEGVLNGVLIKGVRKLVSLGINKFQTVFNDITLSNAGDKASKTETNNNYDDVETEVEYIQSSAIFNLGSTSKTITMYGLIITETYFLSWGESPPPEPVTITGDVPSSPITFRVSEFWPYKTADGQPVYNTTTGAIDNSPVP